MLESIQQASESIYIEMYVFSDDTQEDYDFIGIITEKAKSGIRVIIVADAFGSKNLKKKTTEILKQSGVEFIFFSHWLRHIHRKVLIIDEKIAFIGGVNIGKRFLLWDDLQLQIRGTIVKKILSSFSYTYKMAGGKNKSILEYKDRKISAKLKFWILDHWPNKNIHTLKKHYVKKITQAKSKIQIITPYFSPPRWMISLLDDASRRNVKIEILIPQASDLPIIDKLNYFYMNKLHPIGVDFYLTKNMNHSKLLLIDDKEGILGSQNIDHLSFEINSEIGIFFQEKSLLKKLSTVIELWKKDSIQFHPTQYKAKAIDFLIFALVKILHPIL